MKKQKQNWRTKDQQQIASLQTQFTKINVDLFQEGFWQGNIKCN